MQVSCSQRFFGGIDKVTYTDWQPDFKKETPSVLVEVEAKQMQKSRFDPFFLLNAKHYVVPEILIYPTEHSPKTHTDFSGSLRCPHNAGFGPRI